MASAPGAAGAGAGYPQWAVDEETGAINEVANAGEKAVLETVAAGDTLIFFTSQQAAQNYVNSHGGAPSAPFNTAQQAASGAAASASSAIGSGVDGLAAIGAALHTFVSHALNKYMWISVGWGVLGLLLLLAGTFLWLRHSGEVPALPFGIGVL